MLIPQVDPRGQLPPGHAPEVQMVAEPAVKQVLGVERVLERGRGSPLRGDDRVVAEVPPHVVAEELLAPVGLPRATTSKVSWSSSATPPGPSLPLAPPSADIKIPPGPQWIVWGREYPALAASSSAPISRITSGARGSGLVSSM